MPGNWSGLAERAPLNIGMVLLLTDGSLLAQDDFTIDWWRYWPDAGGDYIAGCWAPAAQSHGRRRRFAAAVLADGRVFVAGGDDSEDASPAPAAEIYDPVADLWTKLAAPPEGWRKLGNPLCCVLPNGEVLLGHPASGACRLFDPKADTWRSTADRRLQNMPDESWVLLADGSVLAIGGGPLAQRYAAGSWRDTPPAGGGEAAATGAGGPAILLRDGAVFALRPGGGTAILPPGAAPGSGAWKPGPALPAGQGNFAVGDASLCLLANDRLLVCAQAAGDPLFQVFEIAGATVTALPNPLWKADAAPAAPRLLLLPTGQALLSDGSPDACIFDPAGEASPAGRPEITQAPGSLTPGERHLLRGRRFNGPSQAGAGGAGGAVNYPLVRLRRTDRAGANTLIYCRTANHSSMAVATGAAEQETSFTVPPAILPGRYEIELVACGVASQAVLVAVKPAPPPPAPLDGVDTFDKRFQLAMFHRDLNEVHLLADFISGRPEVSLNTLTVPDPASKDSLTAQEALNGVGAIRFPPVGTPEERARQATLLLLVKDRLNGLAYPARGISVAFTSMYAGVSVAHEMPEASALAPAAIAPGRNGCRRQGAARAAFAPPPPDRLGFAVEAYPNLVEYAKIFRKWMGRAPKAAILVAVLTILLSCDVLVCSATLRQAAGLPNAVVNDVTCNIAATEDAADPGFSKPPPARISAACDTLLAGQQDGGIGPQAGLAGRQAVESLFVGWKFWLHPIGWGVKLFGPAARYQLLDAAVTTVPAGTMLDLPPGCAPQAACDQEETVADFAATVVNMFSNAVLPAMFGLLGTLSGIMRSVVAKVRASTLSPRDVRLTASLLPLGMIAGLTVGLFLSPDAGSSALSGQAISAAGLAFLAGYGADGYFAMLDAILTRVFPTTPPPRP